MEKPNIHLFATSNRRYFYDVNRNEIVMISPRCFSDLNEGVGLECSCEIAGLKQDGYLKSTYVEHQEHPVTSYLEAYLNNRLSQMILQITQSCNLRCEYCVYSGSYQNRNHTQKQMSEDIAKKAIDFFISHSKDSGKLQLSFYGGEPLLRVDFMQMCIDYIHEKGAGKEVGFNLTTNGTLLNEHVMDFLVHNSISVMFSLDGPEAVHDYHRKFAQSDKGSFRVLKENVERLKKRYPEYFSKCISFNTVLDQSRDFSCVDNYISGEEWLKDTRFNSSTITSDYSSDPIEPSPAFIAQYEYEYFKILLSKLHKVSDAHTSQLAMGRWNQLARKIKSTVFHDGSGQLPRKAHHGGPCIPGVLRTFVTADGQIFPCERVSEKSDLARIGDIEHGFDLDKVKTALNIGQTNENQCQSCWAIRYCDICLRTVDGLDHVSSRLQNEACQSVRYNGDQMLKDYCVINDLGYDIQEEDGMQ